MPYNSPMLDRYSPLSSRSGAAAMAQPLPRDRARAPLLDMQPPTPRNLGQGVGGKALDMGTNIAMQMAIRAGMNAMFPGSGEAGSLFGATGGGSNPLVAAGGGLDPTKIVGPIAGGK